MPTPIANGCDAFTVPSGSVVAATGNAQLTNSENWSSAYGTPVSGNMKFFMGYCDVMTSTEVANMNAAGVGVFHDAFGNVVGGVHRHHFA